MGVSQVVSTCLRGIWQDFKKMLEYTVNVRRFVKKRNC